jgi:hypothetical protein
LIKKPLKRNLRRRCKNENANVSLRRNKSVRKSWLTWKKGRKCLLKKRRPRMMIPMRLNSRNASRRNLTN